MATPHKIKIDTLVDYIVNKIYEKIINREAEDFLRENDIISYYSNSFLYDYIPTQQLINEAIYSINSKFFGAKLELPVIDYKFVEVIEPQNRNNKERAFFFNYGASQRELDMFLGGMLGGDNSLRKYKTRKPAEQIMCIVKTSQKVDAYLKIKVDCTSSHPDERKTGIDTSNHIYVFNSMFSDYRQDEEIYLDFDNFDYFDKNGYKIYYSKNEFKDIDIDILKNYNFNDNEDNTTTMCIVVSVQNSGIFTLTELKIDNTPKSLLALPQFQGQRFFSEPSNDFYVFKSDLHNISVGQQLNLDMDLFENFTTPNFANIYYNKNEFNMYDIRELKTYNFY